MKRTLRSRSESFTLGEIRELERKSDVWAPGVDPKRDYVEVRRQMSNLRSRICDDVGTRDPALVYTAMVPETTQHSTELGRDSGTRVP